VGVHHKVLWVLQWVFGLYFIAVGVMHFIVPEGLPDMLSWMYDVSDTLHVIAGGAEILGGLGLILPGLTGIRPELTVWAAVGLILVMIGAMIFHIDNGDTLPLGTNVINAAVLTYIAYGRARLAPMSPKAVAS
jgi:putative oxidoreductase